jgi:hypothetical protein
MRTRPARRFGADSRRTWCPFRANSGGWRFRRVNLGLGYAFLATSGRKTLNRYKCLAALILFVFRVRRDFVEQVLLNGPNEALWCAVFRINKHDVLWIAAWRVD